MQYLVGHSIGRYHILEQLGQGGMATVYMAYDTRLERKVAVKLIRKEAFPAEVHDRILKRFEREAKVLARMSHPNIVKVYDSGEYNGAPYLVMDLVSGKTLKDIPKPLHYRHALQLLLLVAQALEHAHQNGILHRDVKPSNILIGADGEPMLADFGIAKLLEEGEGHTLTGTGVGVGTPEYMAPEQGLGKEVDGRADIYALGIVLFELLTGQKPFTADTPMAVVIKQINDPLPHPRQLNIDIPEEVERILFRALAKQPEKRYSAMGVLVAALESVLSENDLQSGATSRQPEENRERATGTESVTRDVFLSQAAVALPASTDPVQKEQRKIRLLYVFGGVGLLGVVSLGILLINYGLSTIKNSLTSQSEEPPAVSGVVITEPPATRPTEPQSVAEEKPVQDSTIDAAIPSFAPDVIQLNNVHDLKEIHRWNDTYNYQGFVSWQPDSQGFFLADFGYGYARYDIPSLSVQRFQENMQNIYMAALSPNGQFYATRDRSYNQIDIWQHGTDELVCSIHGDTGYDNSYPVFSPNGQIIAGVMDDAVHFWDSIDGSLLTTLDPNLNLQFGTYGIPEVVSVFSNDSKYFAVGNTHTGEIKVWDVETHNLLSIIHWHERLESLSFSPDGTILVSAGFAYSNRDVLRLWEVSTGDLIRKVTKSNENISSTAFSVDGRLVFSGSELGAVRAWEVPGGNLIATIANTGGAVNLVSISPDGKYLVTAGEEVVLFGIQTP